MGLPGLSSIAGNLQTSKIKVKTTESFDPICHMISMKPKFADGLRRTVVHRRESANMNSQNDGNRKYWFTLVMSSTWNLNLPVDVLGLSSMAGHPLMINDEVGTWMGPWSALSRSPVHGTLWPEKIPGGAEQEFVLIFIWNPGRDGSRPHGHRTNSLEPKNFFHKGTGKAQVNHCNSKPSTWHHSHHDMVCSKTTSRDHWNMAPSMGGSYRTGCYPPWHVL